MDAEQRMGAHRALCAIARFYAEPANQRRFEEWKRRRVDPGKDTARREDECPREGTSEKG